MNTDIKIKGGIAVRKQKSRRASSMAVSIPPKKMTGPGFYMIVSLAAVKDIIDIVADISIILSIFTFFTGLAITYIVWFYFFYNNVKLNSRKLATFAVSAIIEMIPIINIIPTYTFTLFIIRAIENNTG